MALAFLAFAWLLGLAAAAFTGGDPAASTAAAGLLAAASFGLRPRAGTLLLIAAGASLVFFAAWRYDSAGTSAVWHPPGGQAQDKVPVQVTAVVSAEPDEQGLWRTYRLELRQESLDGGWRQTAGTVLLRLSPYPPYELGDVLDVRGVLTPPQAVDDLDYREYLLRSGVSGVIEYPDSVKRLGHEREAFLPAALGGVRDRLSGSLSDALPEPEASLAGGILLGARQSIPRDLRDDMNATGTSHLVAVSGQNVMLVAGLLIAVLTTTVGRRRAAWLTLAGIIGYAMLVGAQPPVIRAAIMGSLYVTSVALGRQNTAFVALLMAAAAMMALDPRVVHDVSFQMSFAAALGLVLLSGSLRARIESFVDPGLAALWPVRSTVELLAVTAAAIAFTLPITAVNFHRVSLIAPLANLFAVPAFLAVAVTAGVTAIAGLVPGAGAYTVWLSWPPAAYMVAVVRFFASLPLASIELRGIGTGHAIAYYALLGGGAWLLARRPATPPAPAKAAAASRALIPASGLALLLGLGSVLVWLIVTAPASAQLRVTFLDVGQGDAILVQAPGGQRVLVDGGPGGDAIRAALGRRLPFYDRRIDLVVLTHPQADHMGGLPAVLESYDVRRVLTDPYGENSAAYRGWSEALQRSGVPRAEATRGQTVELGDGARIDVLGPPTQAPPGDESTNDDAVVLRVTMGGVSFLLTSDIGEVGERTLLTEGTDVRSTVLKVAHHGSRFSSTPDFLRRAEAQVAVISVGKGNPFGHPTPEVLERLRGDLVLRTDQQGDVTVSTDGTRLWVQTQR